MQRDPVRILWLDCTGGLVVGVLVLAASAWLSELFALPRALLVCAGVANVVYGTYSLSLVRRAVRPRALVLLLVVANAVWSLLCIVAALTFAGRATVLGMLHMMGEATVVGTLALLEWRYRGALTSGTRPEL